MSYTTCAFSIAHIDLLLIPVLPTYCKQLLEAVVVDKDIYYYTFRSFEVGPFMHNGYHCNVDYIKYCLGHTIWIP